MGCPKAADHSLSLDNSDCFKTILIRSFGENNFNLNNKINIAASLNEDELIPRGHHVSISCNPCRPFNHSCNNCVVLWTAISCVISKSRIY